MMIRSASTSRLTAQHLFRGLSHPENLGNNLSHAKPSRWTWGGCIWIRPSAIKVDSYKDDHQTMENFSIGIAPHSSQLLVQYSRFPYKLNTIDLHCGVCLDRKGKRDVRNTRTKGETAA